MERQTLQKNPSLKTRKLDKEDALRKPFRSVAINDQSPPIIPLMDSKTENRFFLKELECKINIDPIFVSKIWSSYQRQKFNDSTRNDSDYAKSRRDSIKFLTKLSAKLGIISRIPD